MSETNVHIKSCDDNLNAFFACLNKEGTPKGDFNACRSTYSTLKTCIDTAVKESTKKDGDGGGGGGPDNNTDKSLSGALQAAMPRVFKNVEDLPRERTIISDTLAKIAPHIFDPKDDDDDGDGDKKD